MTKIKVEVEFEIDDAVWGSASTDQDERDWFWDEVIPSSMLLLHSNEVGEIIAETTEFKITEVTNERT
jgi:hypothetical protein